VLSIIQKDMEQLLREEDGRKDDDDGGRTRMAGTTILIAITTISGFNFGTITSTNNINNDKRFFSVINLYAIMIFYILYNA
jgi:hypothetical protein